MVGAMTSVGVIDKPSPRRRPLLGLAHQHQPKAASGERRVLVWAGDVLLRLACFEAHHGHTRVSDQPVELGDQTVAVAPERRRRRDGVAPVEEELHHPTLVLQALDVAPDPDAIHRRAAEADVLGQ